MTAAMAAVGVMIGSLATVLAAGFWSWGTEPCG
jgi:hypothetical protein